MGQKTNPIGNRLDTSKGGIETGMKNYVIKSLKIVKFVST